MRIELAPSYPNLLDLPTRSRAGYLGYLSRTFFKPEYVNADGSIQTENLAGIEYFQQRPDILEFLSAYRLSNKSKRRQEAIRRAAKISEIETQLIIQSDQERPTVDPITQMRAAEVGKILPALEGSVQLGTAERIAESHVLTANSPFRPFVERVKSEWNRFKDTASSIGRWAEPTSRVILACSSLLTGGQPAYADTIPSPAPIVAAIDQNKIIEERAKAVADNLPMIHQAAFAGVSKATEANNTLYHNYPPESLLAVITGTIARAEDWSNRLRADENPEKLRTFLSSPQGRSDLEQIAFEYALRYTRYYNPMGEEDYPQDFLEFQQRVQSIAGFNQRAFQTMVRVVFENGIFNSTKAFMVEKAAKITADLHEPLTDNPNEYMEMMGRYLNMPGANGTVFHAIVLINLFQRDPTTSIPDMDVQTFLSKIRNIKGVDEKLVKAIEAIGIFKDPDSMKLTIRILQATVDGFNKRQMSDVEFTDYWGNLTDKPEPLNSADQYKDQSDFLKKRSILV